MIIRLISCIWLIFFIYIGVWQIIDAPKQMKRDKLFRDKELRPYVLYIDSFYKVRNRLPAETEYNTWKANYYLKNHSGEEARIDSCMKQGLMWQFGADYNRSDSSFPDELKPKPAGVNWSKEYVLSVWRGEWFEYYTSWDHKYISNNYKQIDGVIGFFVFAFIGSVPFIVVLIGRLIKNHKRHLFS